MTQTKTIVRKTQRVVHTPESQLRHPIQLAKAMWYDLLASRELAWRLMVRDISAQYRQSILGIAWAVIPATVTAAIFTFAKNRGIVSIGATDLPYPAYVVFSTTLWLTFVEALNGPAIAVSNAKQMLAKIHFPREALILSKLGEIFFNFGIKLFLIVGLFLWFRIPVGWTVLIAPVALVHLILLGTAIGVFLAPLGALYQDFSKGITVLTSLWILLTPVVYPVPSGGDMMGTIVKLNPVSPLLVTTRELATTGVVSDPVGFWLASALAFVGLLAAWLFYRLAMPFIVERMSS